MIGPIIEAANVSKVLGSGPTRVQALKDVNLTLNGGELTVLMGPSGSGKTTLLSISAACSADRAGLCEFAAPAPAGRVRKSLRRSGDSISASYSNPITFFPPSRPPKMFGWRLTARRARA